MCVSFVSFFFKQKTAYEVRISDWSSDVCSSDLEGRGPCLATCRRTDLKDRRMEIGPIRNDDDHRAAVDEIRALWNAEAGSADEDRLDVLATLADEYERKRWPGQHQVCCSYRGNHLPLHVCVLASLLAVNPFRSRLERKSGV